MTTQTTNSRPQMNTTITRLYTVGTGLRTLTMKSLMSTSLMKGPMMPITESTCMITLGMMTKSESLSEVQTGTYIALVNHDSFSAAYSSDDLVY